MAAKKATRVTRKRKRPHAEMGERMRTRRRELFDEAQRLVLEAKELGQVVSDESVLPGAEFATVEAFARHVEFKSASHYARIERGEVMPHNRKLARICNALGIVQHWACSGRGRRLLRAGESNAVEGC